MLHTCLLTCRADAAVSDPDFLTGLILAVPAHHGFAGLLEPADSIAALGLAR